MKYVNPNKFIQFELWNSCKNGCKFCCNKGQKDLDKEESLDYILNILSSKKMLAYNEVGFIGGEFFNDEISDEVIRKKFYKLFEISADLVKKDIITKIYITAALLYDIKKLLVPFLDYLKELNILDKCLLCTSYDILYRFKTKKHEDLWKDNMKYLICNYPELRLHTEIIMTQGFIDAVLNNQFDIAEFSKEYNTHIDYIEPASGLYYKNKQDCANDLPGFFPTKKSFLAFLKNQYNNLDFKTLLSMEARSSKFYYICEGERRETDDNRRQTQGEINFLYDNIKKYQMGFIDSDEIMRDVVEQFYDTFGE